VNINSSRPWRSVEIFHISRHLLPEKKAKKTKAKLSVKIHGIFLKAGKIIINNPSNTSSVVGLLHRRSLLLLEKKDIVDSTF
jgi:hypothetical protein